MDILNFFSRDAGQKRRQKLDQYVDNLNLERFLPPNLRPAGGLLVEANPVSAVGGAMQSASVAFDPKQTAEARKRAAVDMGVEMAMTLAPTALVRMGYLAAPAGLMETFATPPVDAAVDMGRGLLSDATYAARSVADGDFGGVFDVFRPSGQPQSLSAASSDTSPIIRAFHGTPHDFDRFNLSKIGTGEGAQVYGHGLYFAEAEPVAKSYRDQLSRQVTKGGLPLQSHPSDSPQAAAEHSIARLVADGWSPQDAIKKEASEWRSQAKKYREVSSGHSDPDVVRSGERTARSFDDIADAIESEDPTKYKKNKGRIYEVNIQGSPDQFLDWDKPLSEQPSIARLLGYDDPDAIAAAKAEQYAKFRVPQNATFEELFAPLNEQEQLAAESLTAMPMSWGNMTGKDAYEAMKDKLGALDWPTTADADTRRRYGKKAASKASSAMREAGILGIKYFDQMSRGAGKGSRNYVIFDDKIIDIVRKYGIAGAAALLGVSTADVQGALAQEQGAQSQRGLLD